MADLKSLVVAAQGGNKEAFGQLVSRFQNMATVGAYAMLGDWQLAQDAAQEAFIDAYLSLPKLREPAAFPGWFRRIVIKHSDRQIRGKRLPTVSFDATYAIPCPIPEPALAVERLQVKERLEEAIASLPPSQRLVITLFYLQEYSYKEMADFLELPISTIKKRLYTARKRLKGSMGTMLKAYLEEKQPSQSEQFTNEVQFFIALKTHDLQQVKRLVEKEPNLLDVRTKWGVASDGYYWPIGFTALHWAAATGDEALLRYLRSRGADVNATTKMGMTPLHIAVLMQQPQIAGLLLPEVIDVDAQTRTGQTALHQAVLRNNVELVQLLLAHRAQIDVTDKHQRTPVAWALAKQQAEMVKLLVTHGAQEEWQHTYPAKSDTPKSPLKRGVPSPLLRGDLGVCRSEEAEKRLVPVGTPVLGRVLNAKGAAMDEGLPLNEVSQQAILSAQGSSASLVLETGIKVIDLFAPIKRGGHNGLFTPLAGVGKMVVLSQLIYNMAAYHDGVTVCIGLEAGEWTANSLMLAWREWGANENVVYVFGDVKESPLEVAETGLTMAEHFRAQGKEVLLLVDSKLALCDKVLPYLKSNIMSTQTAAITTLYYGHLTVGAEPAPLADLDSVIAFDVARAQQRLWPAIDPLRSQARLLTSDLSATTHAQLRTQAQLLLRRYQDLHPMYEKHGLDAFSSHEDRQTAIRARRLQRFLTQPLPGVEPWTALPGEYVTIAETLQGTQAILSGQYDALPEESFYFVGTIEQVVAKGKGC